MTLIENFEKYCDCTDILRNEPMNRHTSFRIGGPADIMVFPKTSEELLNVWKLCRENAVPIHVLGDGANVLVADAGIRGVVVFTNKMDGCEILPNERIRAAAGTRLSALAVTACETSLAGLEFASGIPGTIGGAICMNAGAYGHDISEFIESVTIFCDGAGNTGGKSDSVCASGSVVVKSCEEMEFGYRKSIVQSGEMLVLDAIFKLSRGNSEKIREEIKDLNARRRKTQPLEHHSAGSFFKRPEGHFAGKLIEDSGMKGFSVGDAWVSEKHAGFVVNKGTASANDVLELMRRVQDTVFEKFGVHLEPEVRILGE